MPESPPRHPGRTPGRVNHTLDLSLKGALAGGRTYLGDLEAVHALLALYTQECIQGLVDMSLLKIGADTLQKHIEAEAQRLARVFLGKDATVNPVPGWNTPGKIDQFVKAQANIAEEDPALILFTVFITLAKTVLDAAHAADAGAPDDVWQFPLQQALNDTARLLIGVPARTYEAPGLPPE